MPGGRSCAALGEPVSFALVHAKSQESKGDVRMVELILAGSGTLRVPGEEAALRVVLRVIRALGWISLHASARVYLCTVPCDKRRSFDGLPGRVASVMGMDALAGHLFVFYNRQRDRIKVLYWDRDGFAIWSKRLQEGTYAMPFNALKEQRAEITSPELSALLSGLDLSQAKRRKHYHREPFEAT